MGGYNETGAFGQSIDKFVNVKADTAKVIADAKTATQAAGVALATFSTAWENYANKRFAEPIKELALWVNSIQPEKLERIMDIGTTAAGAVGAAIMGRKTYNMARGLFGKGKAGAGVPGADAAGSMSGGGPTPVMVTNWPGAGYTGGAGMPADLGGLAARMASWRSVASRAVPLVSWDARARP